MSGDKDFAVARCLKCKYGKPYFNGWHGAFCGHFCRTGVVGGAGTTGDCCFYEPSPQNTKKQNRHNAQQPQTEICMGCGEPLLLGKCTNSSCECSRDRMQRSAAANL
jgi:hypothetical protein